MRRLEGMRDQFSRPSRSPSVSYPAPSSELQHTMVCVLEGGLVVNWAEILCEKPSQPLLHSAVTVSVTVETVVAETRDRKKEKRLATQKSVELDDDSCSIECTIAIKKGECRRELRDMVHRFGRCAWMTTVRQSQSMACICTFPTSDANDAIAFAYRSHHREW